MEIDPEIARAMGFSSFGDQAGRKRKRQDLSVAAAPSSPPPSSSSLTGLAATERTGTAPDREPLAAATPQAEDQGLTGETTAEQVQPLQQQQQQGLGQMSREGFRNDQGDVAYFLPSFIEDPWANLRPHV